MRRLGLVIVAVLASAVLVIVVGFPRDEDGPEPIAYGRDACAECRMIISSPGFAAQLRDEKGRLTKYDEVGCLLRAMVARHDGMPGAWVEDHGGGGLVPLLSATLVHMPTKETPMGHGVVAFADRDEARRHAEQHAGAIVQLEDLVRSVTKTARTAPPSDRGRP